MSFPFLFASGSEMRALIFWESLSSPPPCQTGTGSRTEDSSGSYSHKL